MVIRCENQRFCEKWVMFCGLNLDLRTLSSVRCFSTVVPDVIFQRSGRGRGCNVLIEVCLSALNKCKQLFLWPLLWKNHILLVRFVRFHCLKDPLALTVMHCALFILIRRDMGRNLSRGKITASHLEEKMNTEFEVSVVSNFLVSTSSPVRYQKPVKYSCGLYFRPLNPSSCSSRRGHFLRLQKSHFKEK